MASINFDIKDLPANDGFDLIPDGWYTASVKSAELKATKDNTGKYIAIGYTITGPTHGGRVVFGNLNIKNANAEAERIGLQQMGALMAAIGLGKVQDTDQFVGGKCQIKVGTGKKQEGYEQRNEVKGWKEIEGAVFTMPSSAGTGSAPAVAKAPWG